MNIIVLTAFPAVELVLLFAYLRRGGPESRPRTFGLRCAVSLWNVLFGIAILVLLAEDADWPTVLLLVGLLFGAFHDMFSFQAPRIPKKHRDARSRNRFFSHTTGFLEELLLLLALAAANRRSSRGIEWWYVLLFLLPAVIWFWGRRKHPEFRIRGRDQWYIILSGVLFSADFASLASYAIGILYIRPLVGIGFLVVALMMLADGLMRLFRRSGSYFSLASNHVQEILHSLSGTGIAAVTLLMTGNI